MPAAIRFAPPYALASAGSVTAPSTPNALAFGVQSARKSGALSFSSLVAVWDAGDAECAGVLSDAYCSMWIVPNGVPPMTITATFRPVRSTWNGGIVDEPGVSDVDLRWDLLALARIDLFDGPGSNPRPLGPKLLHPRRDRVSATHVWGPNPWPATGTTSASWVYNGPLNPDPGMPDMLLDIGVRSHHQVVANDVSLVSLAFADFQLRSVMVQMS